MTETSPPLRERAHVGRFRAALVLVYRGFGAPGDDVPASTLMQPRILRYAEDEWRDY